MIFDQNVTMTQLAMVTCYDDDNNDGDGYGDVEDDGDEKYEDIYDE